MKNISFKQYLILRKLYRAQPEKIQLDINSKDFQFLIDNKYIESEQDTETCENKNIVAFFDINNGLSTITKEGINIYYSYFDRYIVRISTIVALVLSIIAMITSIVAFIRTLHF
ncbi:hypothetical protein [Tissierella praeacuta]|uniref:hypothetical protein n=1 Tax=Tissierella praeacuta TaxID=43131 RepID=UPI00334169A3